MVNSTLEVLHRAREIGSHRNYRTIQQNGAHTDTVIVTAVTVALLSTTQVSTVKTVDGS